MKRSPVLTAFKNRFFCYRHTIGECDCQMTCCDPPEKRIEALRKAKAKNESSSDEPAA